MMETKPQFWVEVVETATGRVDRRLGPMSERKAERVTSAMVSKAADAYHVDMRRVPAGYVAPTEARP